MNNLNRRHCTDASGHSIELLTADGARLVAHVHSAADPVGAVVIAGAMAVPCAAYRRFAEHLAGAGLTTLRFDYRDFGESGNADVRSSTATATQWAAHDVGAALAWAESQGVPHALVGHSFGGQCLGVAPGGSKLDAVLTVASQFGWYGHWSGLQRLGLWGVWTIAVPLLTAIFGYLPGWAGLKEDIPLGVIREWATWCRAPGYLLDHVPGAAERYAAVTCPVLAIAVSDDVFAPRPAVEAFALNFPASEIMELVPEEQKQRSIGHFGFFRKSELWPLASAWLVDRLT